MDELARLVNLIGRHDRFILATHVRPDGDALGSVLGLADVLERMGRRVWCVMQDPVPGIYRFLPGWQRIMTGESALAVLSEKLRGRCMAIALDCGDRDRLGRVASLLGGADPLAVIDHHQGNRGFGGCNWIEPDRSSTGEMVCDLIGALGQPFSADAATSLYTAIVTDTGSFRYQGTTAHTHRIVARLVDSGAEPCMIGEQLYDKYSLARLQLLQMVLATLSMHGNGRIAVITATEEMFRNTGTGLEDTENFINLPRAVASVEVVVFARQWHSGVSVSLRSRGQCNVAAIAAGFGGGGHARASGFRTEEASLEQVVEEVVASIKQEFDARAAAATD